MEGKLIKTDTGNYVIETDKGILSSTFDAGKFEHKLSLTNCQAIERGYDLDAIIKNNTNEYITTNIRKFNYGFEKGFQKALEIFGDRKFTEEDVLNLLSDYGYDLLYADKLFEGTPKEWMEQSLQQAEWDVTFDPKEKDEEGRLILKKKITQNNYDSRTKS